MEVIQLKTGGAAGSNEAAAKVENMQLQHQYEDVYGQGWTASKPVKGDKLAPLELNAEKAMILLQMRSCYVLVLFCDMLKPSARDLDKLWRTFDDKDIQDRVGEVDSCCMTVQATLLTVWGSMIQDLLAVGAGGTASSGSAKAEVDDAAETSRGLFSATSLFSFGSGERAPPADFLASLRLTIQDKLLRTGSCSGEERP